MSEKKFAAMMKSPSNAMFVSGLFGAIAGQLYSFIICDVFVQAVPFSLEIIQKAAVATIAFFVGIVRRL